MRSARSYFALAVLSTFLLADAGVQAADVPGTLTATLITPDTIQVDSFAKASVTFEGVPTSDPEHGDVHVHCEVRAPIIGGPRGFVAPCSNPAKAVPLTEFKNAGSTVDFKIPNEFAGVSGIFFQVYVTYADNDGVSSNLVATKAGTKSFSVAKKESGRPADVPGTLTAKLTTPKTIQVGSTAKAQVTFDGVPSSDPVHGDVHVHCEVRAPVGGGRALCSNPAQAVPLTEFKNAGATVDFKIPKEFAGVSSVFFQVYVTYADNDGVSSNLVAAKAGTESFNVAAKEGPARCRQ